MKVAKVFNARLTFDDNSVAFNFQFDNTLHSVIITSIEDILLDPLQDEAYCYMIDLINR